VVAGPALIHTTAAAPTSAAAGPAFVHTVSGAPSAIGGPAFIHTVSGFPGKSQGPAFVHAPFGATSALTAKLLRLDTDKVNLAEISEIEVARLSGIERSAGGPVELWTDDFTGEITIGGSTSQTTTTIGRAGGSTGLNNSQIVVAQTSINRVGSLTVGPVGVPDALSLGARGVSKALNDGVNLTKDAELLTSSVLGWINELLSRPCVGTEMIYENTSGVQIDEGSAVAVFDNDEIQEADATADGELSRFLGVLQQDTAAAAFGPVATTGRQTCKFAPGEGAGPHNNKIVYLSTAAGFLTLAVPTTLGNVILPVGYVADDSAYADGPGGNMEVHLVRQEKRVV